MTKFHCKLNLTVVFITFFSLCFFQNYAKYTILYDFYKSQLTFLTVHTVLQFQMARRRARHFSIKSALGGSRLLDRIQSAHLCGQTSGHKMDTIRAKPDE